MNTLKSIHIEKGHFSQLKSKPETSNLINLHVIHGVILIGSVSNQFIQRPFFGLSQFFVSQK